MAKDSTPHCWPACNRTRFAPSPTGFLHRGHIWSALWVWGLARRCGAEVLLRIEDHDLSRSRPQYHDAIRKDLEYLGFQWSGESVQSHHNERYREVLERFRNQGRIYPCKCTRSQLRATATPDQLQAGEEIPYSNTCRHANLKENGNALRIQLPDAVAHWQDLFHGPEQQHPSELWGDTTVRDRHGQWSYQFSSVVDDIFEGIDLVVRGEDIRPSTGRQCALAALISPTHSHERIYAHHSLLYTPEGRKLSKRQWDAGIGAERESGVSSQRLLGEVCAQGGLLKSPQNIDLEEALARIADSLPKPCF